MLCRPNKPNIKVTRLSRNLYRLIQPRKGKIYRYNALKATFNTLQKYLGKILEMSADDYLFQMRPNEDIKLITEYQSQMFHQKVVQLIFVRTHVFFEVVSLSAQSGVF